VRQTNDASIRIGIDAANIRLGGGITHLLELLDALDVRTMQINQVYIWASEQTLQRLPNQDWLIKINPPSLNQGLIARIGWQCYGLSKAAKAACCDVLLIPGGSYFGSFTPAVTMSQNLFPFEWSMIKLSGFSVRTFKFILLRWAQSWSFHRSSGVIFLTEHAKNTVLKVTGHLRAKQAIISHGLNPRFDYHPKIQLPIEQYSAKLPYQLIYISTVDVYKNQAQVILAIEQLRLKGYPLALAIIGPAEISALEKLQKLQSKIDPMRSWLQYLGELSYESLHLMYQKSDLSIFASSCETFGMTVLENMSVGLPIACSNQSSMHEILEEGGLYFDPSNPSDIAAVVENYLLHPQLREEKQKIAHAISMKYSWKRCAHETVYFIRKVLASQNN